MGEHIVPSRVYFVVFALLMLCTLLTVQIAFIDLGALNTIAALGIAIVKAVLVILFFMHAKYSSRLTWTVIGGGVFGLVLLLGLTMTDYLARSFGSY